MQSSKTTLQNIVSQLQNKYGCHTVILYGSRARGDANQTSDYDITAICPEGEAERYCDFINDAYVDAFIYPEAHTEKPDDSFIRMKDGIVICQKNTLGDQLLKKIQERYANGPKKIPAWEKNVISTWSNKMLKRCETADIDGNYRRHWLLFDLLQAYFQLRDLWYTGPKESFQYLKQNDPTTYLLFDKALKPNASVGDIKDLVKNVILS
jgi:predicted nucleotidyltransferase